jgi:hypothetical protein
VASGDGDGGVSARPATRLFGGLDEAGLGPLLGPLTLGWSVFRAPAGSTDLWRTLHGAVTREPADDRSAFVVADSKKVFLRTDRSALRLESTALGFLALLDARRKLPACAADVVWRSPPELAPDEAVRASHPWYADPGTPWPRHADAGALELRVERLARAMRAAGVELAEAGVRVLPEGVLNLSFERTQNKSTTHWEFSCAVLKRLWERHAHEGLHLVIDRHGGRFHYGPLLARAFPHALVERIDEAPSLAEYRMTGHGPDSGRSAHLLFAERAESRSFATALGSCLAKYARETCMGAFNAYFERLAPAVAPTAGYNQDGRRWLCEVAPFLERAGLGHGHLVRTR